MNIFLFLRNKYENFKYIKLRKEKLKMAGSIKLPHKCPKCGKIATTKAELDREFGTRQTSPTTVTNQSWCKKCR